MKYGIALGIIVLILFAAIGSWVSEPRRGGLGAQTDENTKLSKASYGFLMVFGVIMITGFAIYVIKKILKNDCSYIKNLA